MRALVIPRHGPPDVFEERDLPDAPLGAREVRVCVEAAGVNFADLLGRLGLYPDAPPFPYAPGYEVAGVVEEAGTDADDRLRPGTRVMAITRFGGYADRVVVPSHAAVPLAPGIGFPLAAATPVNYLTAWLALVHVGAAKAGERVLIHGAAGGVGLAALDLARPLGVTIYATAGSAEKCRRLEALGVERAFDYRAGDYEREIRAHLGGAGVHLILDPLGPASFRKGLRLLEPLGRIVCLGVAGLVAGPRRRLWHAIRAMLRLRKVSPIALMNANRGIHGLNLGHLFPLETEIRRGLERLAGQLADGSIRPTLDRTFPLTAAGAAEAHAYLHARRNFGKVVLASASA